MDAAIQIKGTRDGLTVTLGTGDLERQCEELSAHLSSRGAFFRGGLVSLETGPRVLDAQAIGRVTAVLAEHGMALRSVLAHDEATQATALALGLHVIKPERATAALEAAGGPPDAGFAPPSPGVSGEAAAGPEAHSVAGPEPAAVEREGQAEALARSGTRGLVLRRRLRAGQAVRHSGSVVIIGDVNAGAEVIAGGDIVVWGRLRGIAHAGCLGNTAAAVCALDMAPQQLRIADLVTRDDAGNASHAEGQPQVASVRDGLIVVERWSAMRWRD